MKLCNIFVTNMNTKNLFSLGSWRVGYSIMVEPLAKLGVESVMATGPFRNCVNMFYKHFSMVNFLEYSKRFGGIFYIDEHIFDTPDFPHYKKDVTDYCLKMAEQVDVTMCHTQKVRDCVREKGFVAEYVPLSNDVGMFDAGEVGYKHGGNVCWFGHEMSLIMMNGMKFPCHIDLITKLEHIRRIDLSGDFSLVNHDFRCKLNNQLDNYDICVIPYKNKKDSLVKKVQHPNRVISAVYAGKIAVTNSREMLVDCGMEDYVVCADEIGDGIEWVWANPDKAVEMTNKGQEFIEKVHSPDAVAPKWVQFFEYADRLNKERKGVVHV